MEFLAILILLLFIAGILWGAAKLMFGIMIAAMIYLGLASAKDKIDEWTKL